MRYRLLGSTGLMVSEVGFGAWAIGGTSYGKVDRKDSLRALAKAEELGCNFVDTASVYGDSELVLGEFLKGRRNKWLIATKYSGQKPGMLETVDEQLKRLQIDSIDFYQLHWCPRGDGRHLYDDLYRLKAVGKVRFIGVSLYSTADIDYVLDCTAIEGIQVPFSLLNPDPFLDRLGQIREKKIGVIVRSSLESGFLSGKYTRESVFSDPQDQRYQWSKKEVTRMVESVEQFQFLEEEAGSLLEAAVRYPLSFPEASTVILGTKTPGQAATNFGLGGRGALKTETLSRIQSLQSEWGLRSLSWTRPYSSFKRIAAKISR